MTAKGYILLQEAVAICLLCLLCTATALTFSRCLKVQQQNLALQRFLQAAEDALAGAEISEVSVNKCLLGAQEQFVEVEVSVGETKLNLVQAANVAEAERLSDAGSAF